MSARTEFAVWAAMLGGAILALRFAWGADYGMLAMLVFGMLGWACWFMEWRFGRILTRNIRVLFGADVLNTVIYGDDNDG